MVNEHLKLTTSYLFKIIVPEFFISPQFIVFFLVRTLLKKMLFSLFHIILHF